MFQYKNQLMYGCLGKSREWFNNNFVSFPPQILQFTGTKNINGCIVDLSNFENKLICLSQ